jgi:hypothetical protein
LNDNKEEKYMNPFRDFELKHDELKKAEEHRVMITIKSDYGWGSGWTSGERKRFEDIVYSALEGAGYDVVPPEDDLGCPHLRVKAGLPMHMRDNRLDLYMHPMEFTGYAKPEDVEKIMNILNNECSDAVYGTELVIDEEVYDLNDYGYKKIIMENAGEIMDCIEKARGKGYVPYEVGFEFARECRIPRYGDGSGLGFSDVDITTISDIVKVAEVLKEYELKKENNKVYNAEEDYER